MDKVGGRWVPKNLTDEHTRCRMGDFCIWSFTPIKERSVCSKSWEGMKTWINHAIPKTKNESMTWEHLLPAPARKFKATPVRNAASVFRNHKGELHVDFIHPGNTVTARRCCGTPARLQEAIRCNWRGSVSVTSVCTTTAGSTLPTATLRPGGYGLFSPQSPIRAQWFPSPSSP